MLTRLCAQRMFLLRPDEETNQIYLCGRAVRHHRAAHGGHVEPPSRRAARPRSTGGEFTEHLHKLMARAMNALRGRWGYFWEAGPPSLVHLATPDDVLAKLVYVATNPVAAGLVEHAQDWPGVTGWPALCAGEEIVVRRPDVFFREDGPMPEEVTLRLGLPDALGDHASFRAALAQAVAARELELARDRAAAGHDVLGVEAVCAQQFTDTPTAAMPRRRLNPRIAARERWVRVVLIPPSAPSRPPTASLATPGAPASGPSSRPAPTPCTASQASPSPPPIVDGPPAIPIG